MKNVALTFVIVMTLIITPFAIYATWEQSKETGYIMTHFR